MTTKIAGRLPGGDLNGLDVVEHDARQHPDRPVLIVIKATTRKITTNVGDDSDPYTVQLGIDHIEVIRDDGLAAQFVATELGQAYERRTGKVPLPFGMVVDGPASTLTVDSDELEDGARD